MNLATKATLKAAELQVPISSIITSSLLITVCLLNLPLPRAHALIM